MLRLLFCVKEMYCFHRGKKLKCLEARENNNSSSSSSSSSRTANQSCIVPAHKSTPAPSTAAAAGSSTATAHAERIQCRGTNGAGVPAVYCWVSCTCYMLKVQTATSTYELYTAAALLQLQCSRLHAVLKTAGARTGLCCFSVSLICNTELVTPLAR